jgi:hypothetical protein
MRISTTKTKTMAFEGKSQVICKIVIENNATEKEITLAIWVLMCYEKVKLSL